MDAGSCDATCTQSTADVCSATFLANTLVGNGVKVAHCNDKWLVIAGDGSPGGIFTPNMDDTPFPPAGACSDAQQSAGSGTDCRTGMDTLDESRNFEMYFPLNVELLATSASTNNVNIYDCGDGTDNTLTTGGQQCAQSKTHCQSLESCCSALDKLAAQLCACDSTARSFDALLCLVSLCQLEINLSMLFAINLSFVSAGRFDGHRLRDSCRRWHWDGC